MDPPTAGGSHPWFRVEAFDPLSHFGPALLLI